MTFAAVKVAALLLALAGEVDVTDVVDRIGTVEALSASGGDVRG